MSSKYLIIIILSLSLLLSGCSPTSEPLKRTLLMLDTTISITLYNDTQAQADILDKAFDIIKKYEGMFSKSIETSDVYRINNSSNKFVPVSSDTLNVLEESVYYADISGGAFDITIGAVTNLWDFHAENPSPPSQSEIEAALATINFRDIEFHWSEPPSARLMHKGTSIDLGGIAKGYIADKVAAYLKNNGVTSAIIDLGGNILTVGKRTDKAPWKIAIKKPFAENGELLGTVSVGEKSIVSSGSYERYFEYDGKNYHHIIDPKTGYPAETDLIGVTVISDRSVDGDAMSTAAFVLGLEKGKEMIETFTDVDALFITSDNKIHTTTGFAKKYKLEIF